MVLVYMLTCVFLMGSMLPYIASWIRHGWLQVPHRWYEGVPCPSLDGWFLGLKCLDVWILSRVYTHFPGWKLYRLRGGLRIPTRWCSSSFARLAYFTHISGSSWLDISSYLMGLVDYKRKGRHHIEDVYITSILLSCSERKDCSILSIHKYGMNGFSLCCQAT